MKLSEIKSAILGGKFDSAFGKLYDSDKAVVYARYVKAVDEFCKNFGELGDCDVSLFSVSGRSEICGNHTDHNHGKVIAASISLDIIAVAAKTANNEIRIKSEGFPLDTVSTIGVDKVCESEFYKASAIIRGMCDAFCKSSLKIGGFCAYTTSNVLKGSGLSSSAAFEDMVGNILNHLYNDGKVDNIEIAKMSQYAENVHFGKPCGLMDQVACAAGGFVAIDFKDTQKPIVTRPEFDLSSHGYSLCIVNTGGNHADLNEDYASIPSEMKSVAKALGKEYLRGLDKKAIFDNISSLREKCGDRAIMRALHFFNENQRVEKATVALANNDIAGFLKSVKASGLSSSCMLQNTYTVKNVREQGISLALAAAGEVLDSKPGTAYRVHGGGFAGTIQAFVPNQYVEEFNNMMTKIFGEGNAYVLKVRMYGAVMLDNLID